MTHTTEKVTLYIGLVTKSGEDIPEADAREVIADAMLNRTRITGDGTLISEGWNVTTAQGYWKGEAEPRLIVSFLNLNGDDRVRYIAGRIAGSLYQDAVLVERTPVYYEMV